MSQPVNNVSDCALVLEGGGYRGAFTAGIISVLLEEGIQFPYACGLSAGASNVVNYVAGNQKRIRMAFVEIASLPGNGGLGTFLRGKGYYNADFLYEGCIDNELAPFDWDGFVSNPAQLRIQAFERDTGRTVTFTKDDMTDKLTMVKLVRASSTVPWLMNPLTIGGQVLVDGGLGEGGGIPVRLAEMDGYEKFFCVMTRVHGYRKNPDQGTMGKGIDRLARKYPHLRKAIATRPERYNKELTRLERMAKEGRALLVYPDEMPISSTTLDPEALAAVFDAAKEQARRELPRWKEFLFG